MGDRVVGGTLADVERHHALERERAGDHREGGLELCVLGVGEVGSKRGGHIGGCGRGGEEGGGKGDGLLRSVDAGELLLERR